MEKKPLTKRIIYIQAIVNVRVFQLQEEYNWNLIRTCSNIISATEGGLDAYIAEVSRDVPIDTDMGLLYGYGVLQALYVQQNSIKTLCELLNVEYPDSPDLKANRDIRNDMGHPINRRHKLLGEMYSEINSISPFADIITICTNYPEGKKDNIMSVNRIIPVDLPELIKNQTNEFSQILDNIIESFQEKENQCTVKESDIEFAEHILVKCVMPISRLEPK